MSTLYIFQKTEEEQRFKLAINAHIKGNKVWWTLAEFVLETLQAFLQNRLYWFPSFAVLDIWSRTFPFSVHFRPWLPRVFFRFALYSFLHKLFEQSVFSFLLIGSLFPSNKATIHLTLYERWETYVSQEKNYTFCGGQIKNDHHFYWFFVLF